MEFASLGSGSGGNCTVIRSGDRCVLLDCGFSLKEATLRLAGLGVAIESVTDVLVTHEHSDHLGGVATLANRWGVNVHMTAGTRASAAHLKRPVRDALVHVIAPGQLFELGDLCVEAVSVPHDAGEPVQYTFQSPQGKLGVVSDLGHVPVSVVARYKGCDALLLECNHDPVLLANGPYPYVLKRRVGGPYGHLNNQQAAQFLRAVLHEDLRQVVAIHLSETNNADYLVLEAVEAMCGLHVPFTLTPATQKQGFDWMNI